MSDKKESSTRTKGDPGERDHVQLRSVHRLTPEAFGAPPHQLWTSAYFHDHFYFAWMTFSPEAGTFFLRVMKFESEENRWHACYRFSSRKPQAPPSHQEGLPPGGSAHSTIIGDHLYFHFRTARIEVVLKSDDETSFTKLTTGKSVPANPNASWHEALKQKPENISKDPQLVASSQDLMIAAVDDSTRGASVYAVRIDADKKAEWTLVMDRGADFYTKNSEVFSAKIWNRNLYLLLGSKTQTAPSGTYSGFELLSAPLNPPNTKWNLLAGVPRVSPQGFKVPLSGLGPGMDEFDPHDFLFLEPTPTHLVLGTYSELSGLTCWFTSDGVAWEPLRDSRVEGTVPVTSAQLFSSADGMYLVADIADPDLGKHADIWYISL